ncbi:MAG: 2-C-methyl-D-erythritol 2,4-cyclodiphosphate synthase [Desulfobacterales bacterium]|jgi:2-C-methyl-D-erythritol 2,4-cyclodiphosphate synthase
MRVGIGYDIHRLVEGRPLILGGVPVEYEKGLLGHSDADVLVHAICDALLGAAGLGDIGMHFPDNDPQYKDISSLKLLSKTCQMVIEKGFRVVNLDTILFAEAPKLGTQRHDMQAAIANAMNIAAEQVNIKATTTEGLGAIGRGEGIGAMCVALIEQQRE